jgi:hypothetical protein
LSDSPAGRRHLSGGCDDEIGDRLLQIDFNHDIAGLGVAAAKNV